MAVPTTVICMQIAPEIKTSAKIQKQKTVRFAPGTIDRELLTERHTPSRLLHIKFGRRCFSWRYWFDSIFSAITSHSNDNSPFLQL